MNILILPGDGIGKEVTAQALRVLKAVVGKDATFTEAPIGGEGVKAAGDPLPDATLELGLLQHGHVGGRYNRPKLN